MRRVFVHFDNQYYFGYIIKSIDFNFYLVYVENLGKTIEIESKYIRNLDLYFR